ncbi:MAG: DUF3179 domain-containing protein [Chloroflexi bacterium]|nr:DUF3179 domain-containing protein [Chloroflexota bacterium]
MTLARRWSPAMVAAVLVAAVAIGCSSDLAPTATPPPQAISGSETQSETLAAAIEETTTLEPPVAAVEQADTRLYDPNRIMYRLFPGVFESPANALEALEEIQAMHDVSQVPVLLQTFRFLPPGESLDEFVGTLRALTGQEFGDDWNGWMEWLGKRRGDFRPPDDYAAWKSSIFSQIHPRLGQFLQTAKETARIDLTEVVWGGVPPDGIPDLRNPPTIPAAEADYMQPDDRVLGASINGEHRAYPMRIVNAHEMVNDTLGGEPISLLW